MSVENNNDRRKFGLLVSVTFSLTMNVVFLTYYGQTLKVINWLLQLPLTIPAGAIVGIFASKLVKARMPNAPQFRKGMVFSILMSIVMSAIMCPFALIPRFGFEPMILAGAILEGIPVGVLVSYLVVPACHKIVYKRWSMPEL